MSDSCMYPTCPKCNKGKLLPFFNVKGVNIYVCTVCEIKFGGEDSHWGHRGINYEIKYSK